MRRGTGFNRFSAGGGTVNLPAETREELSRLDSQLFAIWNLGENLLLGWTHSVGALLFLSVRHYAIPESVHGGGDGCGGMPDARQFVNALLAGPKYLKPEEFQRVRKAFTCRIAAVRVDFNIANDRLAALVSDMVRCYGVTLVGNRAVVLLDAVGFSLHYPLDQMAMLNSLACSVNSAYGQLLLKDIRIDFARTTTGDGFYIWNRATTDAANIALYKLVMMILADNAVARRKARSRWVPRLRAAFHIGEHYEFYQVDGVNPTNLSYIVGKVTVDLARLLDRALPGQILFGDFVTQVDGNGSGRPIRYDTLAFVENTAATLDQLNGLDISGGRIENIRCYLTGDSAGGGQYRVNRYYLRDKHGATRAVYNAKINIHLAGAEPIFLGIQSEGLSAFTVEKVEPLSRDAAPTGSLFVGPLPPTQALAQVP